jgi:uncharacterized membrane protein YgcG
VEHGVVMFTVVPQVRVVPSGCTQLPGVVVQNSGTDGPELVPSKHRPTLLHQPQPEVVVQVEQVVAAAQPVGLVHALAIRTTSAQVPVMGIPVPGLTLTQLFVARHQPQGIARRVQESHAVVLAQGSVVVHASKVVRQALPEQVPSVDPLAVPGRHCPEVAHQPQPRAVPTPAQVSQAPNIPQAGGSGRSGGTAVSSGVVSAGGASVGG